MKNAYDEPWTLREVFNAIARFYEPYDEALDLLWNKAGISGVISNVTEARGFLWRQHIMAEKRKKQGGPKKLPTSTLKIELES